MLDRKDKVIFKSIKKKRGVKEEIVKDISFKDDNFFINFTTTFEAFIDFLLKNNIPKAFLTEFFVTFALSYSYQERRESEEEITTNVEDYAEILVSRERFKQLLQENEVFKNKVFQLCYPFLEDLEEINMEIMEKNYESEE